jgi:glutaredoxin
LILYSSTTCPYCKKQNPLWTEMIRQVDGKKYEVVELFRDLEDRDKVMNYLVNNGFIKDSSTPELKILFPNDAFLDKNKMNSTPLTLIVGKDGTVEKAWFGLWNKSTIADVNSSLGISIQPNI